MEVPNSDGSPKPPEPPWPLVRQNSGPVSVLTSFVQQVKELLKTPGTFGPPTYDRFPKPPELSRFLGKK